MNDEPIFTYWKVIKDSGDFKGGEIFTAVRAQCLIKRPEDSTFKLSLISYEAFIIQGTIVEIDKDTYFRHQKAYFLMRS
jgi:hypothetical protein